MLRTIVSKSGLGLLAEDIYYLLESGERMLLSMTANDTADTLTLRFKNKDSSVGTDTAESLVMMVKDNKANELAEAIVRALNGTNVKSQIVKLVEGVQQFEDSKGVRFTFAYESGVSNEDLVIDPDDEALADETVTIGFQNLLAHITSKRSLRTLTALDLKTLLSTAQSCEPPLLPMLMVSSSCLSQVSMTLQEQQQQFQKLLVI